MRNLTCLVYPRTDTCSECDILFQAELKGLNAQLSKTTTEQEKLEVTKKIKTENAVHKMKAVTFYSRKRIARKYSRKNPEHQAICMDYQKKPTVA